MRFSIASTVALAAAVTAHDAASSDLDGSVWASLTTSKNPDYALSKKWNRPAKRQSGWNPPSDMSGALKEVWDHEVKTYNNGNLFAFKNYGWDQLMATKGQINMCVRWESSAKVTAEQRSQVASALQTNYDGWFKWLYGYDNFPYSSVKVNVVGWAVKDKALLEGSTDGIDVYTDKDGEGIPQCSEKCGRFFHQDGDYSSCPGGADRHYDHSLWLTDGMQGGAGGDWGQRIGREYFMGALGSSPAHILQHEMGHTFGLDDFYDWTPTGQTSFIMNAGSAAKVTDFDGWMLRNWWYELSRNRGWQSGSTSGSGSGSSVKPSATGGSNPVVSSAPYEPETPATTGAAEPETPATTQAAEPVITAVPTAEAEAPVAAPTTTATAGRPGRPGGSKGCPRS